MSARSALRVICSPHVGLTTLTLTSSAGTPAASAKSAFTAAWTSSGWSSTWMRRRSPLGPDSVWILASAASMPLSSSTARASSTVWPLASNSQATPPSKSMPRLSPLKIRTPR